MCWPSVKYRKMLTDLQDGDKDSGTDVHWSWDNCVEEFILVSIGNIRTDLFRITLGRSNSFPIVKDFVIYSTRLKTATLPNIPHKDTIYILEAVISQPLCYWRLMQVWCTLSPSQSSIQESQSPQQWCQLQPNSELCWTYLCIHSWHWEGYLRPSWWWESCLRRRLTTTEVLWWCPAFSASQVPCQVSRALTPEDGVFLWDMTYQPMVPNLTCLSRHCQKSRRQNCAYVSKVSSSLSAEVTVATTFYGIWGFLPGCMSVLFWFFFSQNGFSNYLVSSSFAWFYRHFPVFGLL